MHAMCVAAVSKPPPSGQNVIVEVEDAKRRAGRALGLGKKASAYEVQRGLVSRGNKELAREFEDRNKGRRGVAHAESQLADRVERALTEPLLPPQQSRAAKGFADNDVVLNRVSVIEGKLDLSLSSLLPRLDRCVASAVGDPYKQ